MKIIQSSKKLKEAVRKLKKANKRIGFVPTMGFLHEGHLSLVRRSKKENQITVVSIFVNPLQFGPREDYRRYPRDLARDAALLSKEKTDILFVPKTGDFYPKEFQTSVAVNFLSWPLCGLSRPKHFSGVATVVLKLLNAVQPDVLYLGQKDFQQCRVIEQMLADLDVSVTVRRMPIVREPDSLAMSSRNSFLSNSERAQSVFLYRALKKCREWVRSGVRDPKTLKAAMRGVVQTASLGRTDYIEIVNAHTLRPVVELKKGMKILAALAVYFGKTRLIDNILMRV